MVIGGGYKAGAVYTLLEYTNTWPKHPPSLLQNYMGNKCSLLGPLSLSLLPYP